MATPEAERDGDRRTRLLVVDDEPTILELLAASLRFVGFEVRTAESGTEALAVAAQFQPDLLVLDVMLPDLDGFTVTRRLRSGGTRVPVVFLTARDATEDKITGLTIGGDDYVTKPFSLEEVVARIRAVLRRARPELAGPEEGGDDGVLRFADLELDEDTHDVRRAGRLVRLSPTEYKLLHYLLLNADKVLSKAQILDHVWRYDFAGDARIVESYISLLRRKIDTVDPPLIHTLRGFGYSLRLPRG
ncbi:response regulator transcription factor [Streptoalloteichus hindustanus]|uniref:Two-component system, OmpR family, response regulator n=1 Tax=Streptoalloteichus hindustanus TaxID=2017 RepID=A0A1M5L7T7_STRHI|nr:response regulator transcription factor [Streptoalloteichus hindustanus]SHG61174.1 two-component system, OmpR family, response regulator [Streptoalloteichus hindustanus]